MTSVRVLEDSLSGQELQVAEVEVQEVPFEEVSTVLLPLSNELGITKNLLFPKVTPPREIDVPDDLLSQDDPSVEVRIVPDAPTAT